MPRRAPAPSPGLGAKRAALAVTGALSLLLVVALVARATTPPPVAPPPRVVLDERAERDRARGLAAVAHRHAVDGRDRLRADPAGARVALDRALAAYDEAAAIYEAILERHPEPGYDWVGVELDRLRLEKLATRKLRLELA